MQYNKLRLVDAADLGVSDAVTIEFLFKVTTDSGLQSEKAHKSLSQNTRDQWMNCVME